MIGIIARKDKSPTNKDVYNIYDSINKVLLEFNEIGIGIIPNKIDKIKKIIDLCDGIILEGGNDFTSLDIEIIDYIYKNNIPCLGICLGMQSMAYYLNGQISLLGDLSHYQDNTYSHEVMIRNSKIYKDKIIKVNSRHKYYVKSTDMQVVGRSIDNIIEMVEDKNKTFFIGVEWHPEDLLYSNIDSYILFKKFFDTVSKKNIEK